MVDKPDNQHQHTIRIYTLARIEPFQTMRDEMQEEATLARNAGDYGHAAHAQQITERLSWLIRELQAIRLKYDGRRGK